MAEIPHLENGHDANFFCRGWSDLDKMMETVAEWHVNCDDVVEIKTRCRIPMWWMFRQIQWHVIPEPPTTLQGTATWRIQCHDSRTTCHIITLQGAAARRIQWHVISEAEAHITLQGAATWWIHCHDSRGTSHIAGCSHLAKSMSWSCHIAWCKNSIRHSENLFLPYFILMQFKLWRAAAFVSSPIHLFSYKLFQLGYGPYKNAATEHTWSRFSKWLKVLLQFHEHYSSSTKPKTRQLEVTAGNW